MHDNSNGDTKDVVVVAQQESDTNSNDRKSSGKGSSSKNKMNQPSQQQLSPPSAKHHNNMNAHQNQQSNLKTITITVEQHQNNPLASIVDPWVPRIRHNDEYLQCGLDFTPRQRLLSSTENEEEQKVEEEEEAKASAVNDNNSNNGINIQMGNRGAIRLSQALSYNTRLLYLNLSNNNIGNQGAKSLAKCLYTTSSTTDYNTTGNMFQSKTVLRVLNLSKNDISGDQVGIEFGKALRYNTSLQELDMSNNELSLDGILGMLGSGKDDKGDGLISNDTLKYLRLVNNITELSSDEMDRLVECVAKVIRKGDAGNKSSALEVLEMHSRIKDGTLPLDTLDTLSNENVLLLKCSLYGVDSSSHTNVDKVKNHRFQRLTLPPCEHAYEEGDNKRIAQQQLKKILQFNTFYYPILQLNDVLNSPLAQTETTMSLPLKLPEHLKRDEKSGALIGLLPSTTQPLEGIECKLMPNVLAFACNECKLDLVWNLVRYRPDMFCCVNIKGSNALKTSVACGEMCCIS